MSRRSPNRPTNGELERLRRIFTKTQLAEMFHCSVSSIDAWLRQAKFTGADLPPRPDRVAVPVVDMATVRERLFQRVMAICEDETIVDPKARIAQAKLCLEAWQAMAPYAPVEKEVETTDRDALLEKVKKATASATKLRVAAG